MPITEPISEQIVQRIVTTLEAIQRPTYSMNVNVVREGATGNPNASVNKDATIEVIVRAPEKDYKRSYCGRDAYNMLVGLLVRLSTTADATTPPDALRARVLADIDKVIGGDRQCNGLAADSVLVNPKFGNEAESSIPGADIMIDVFFFTTRNNSYSL